MARKQSRARALVGQCAEPLGEGREGVMGEREPRGGLFRGKRWQGFRGGVRFGGGDDGERGGQRVRGRLDVEWESDRRGMKRVRERRAATSFVGLAIKEGERETVASLAFFPWTSTSGACQQVVSTSQRMKRNEGRFQCGQTRDKDKRGKFLALRENKGRWNKGQSRDKAAPARVWDFSLGSVGGLWNFRLALARADDRPSIPSAPPTDPSNHKECPTGVRLHLPAKLLAAARSRC